MKEKITGLLIFLILSCNVFAEKLKTEKYYEKKTGKYMDVAQGHILVKFRDGVSRVKVSALSAGRQCEAAELPYIKKVYKLKVKEGSKLADLVDYYDSLPEVEYAEPDYVRQAFLTPDDPHYDLQWGLNNANGIDIDAPKAWDYETGANDIIIAIVDTGVDLDHPDLKERILTSGHDFISGVDYADDDNEHGTHVAGIACAAGNNGIGIAGVAWNCFILPVKVLDSSGSGYDSNIAAGIRYAAENYAKVINLSLGGSVNGETLRNTIIDINANYDCIMCASSGNEDKETISYPAGYPEVIAVGAINELGERCDVDDWGMSGPVKLGSSYGTYIDLVAPGDKIYSCYNDGSYKEMSGTSMACPFVSGVCGLLFSWNGNKTADEIKEILAQTAVDVSTGTATDGWDIYTGSGTVNVFAAISSMQEGLPAENKLVVGNNKFDPTTGDKAYVYVEVPETASVTVKVYSMLGEEVAALVENVQYPPGEYSFEWDGKNELYRYVSSGLYFVKAKVGSETLVSRVLVLK